MNDYVCQHLQEVQMKLLNNPGNRLKLELEKRALLLEKLHLNIINNDNDKQRISRIHP